MSTWGGPSQHVSDDADETQVPTAATFRNCGETDKEGRPEGWVKKPWKGIEGCKRQQNVVKTMASSLQTNVDREITSNNLKNITIKNNNLDLGGRGPYGVGG